MPSGLVKIAVLAEPWGSTGSVSNGLAAGSALSIHCRAAYRFRCVIRRLGDLPEAARLNSRNLLFERSPWQPAVVQLFNGRNAPMGKYCQPHGDGALANHRREYESDDPAS